MKEPSSVRLRTLVARYGPVRWISRKEANETLSEYLVTIHHNDDGKGGYGQFGLRIVNVDGYLKFKKPLSGYNSYKTTIIGVHAPGVLDFRKIK